VPRQPRSASAKANPAPAGGGWELAACDPGCEARAGWLTARDGTHLPTPLFQPVATAGSLRTLDWRDIRALGYRHVLMNTYHLTVRPGADYLRAAGGVKAFTGWGGSVLTDSGGYQVHSLAHRRSVREHGVEFTDHLDGARWLFTPESVLRAQLSFGVDFAMCLDVCTGLPAGKQRVRRDLELTHAWAREQAQRWPELVAEYAGLTGGRPSLAADIGGSGNLLRDTVERGPTEIMLLKNRRQVTAALPRLFGIVQGGLDEALRLESIAAIGTLPFDGVAVGGLAVGEVREDFLRLTAFTGPRLPEGRVRYLMGVGNPADILFAIAHGFDLFDCVQPARLARHGSAFTSLGALHIKQARFAGDTRPLDPGCRCPVCRDYSRAYLRHLFLLHEHSYARLLTLHNLYFYNDLMKRARRRIEAGTYGKWWPRQYERLDGEVPEGG
jgi:queuine tRNA-ribosyltransferase